MPRVKGPNGLVIPVSEAVAAALLRHPDGEFVLVEDEPKPVKKAAAKPSQK